jgi:hypothetical protein
LFALNGQCHKIFCFWYFSLISFPPAIRGDIRKSRCSTGINDTFATNFPSVVDTSGKFAASVIDTGDNLPPAMLTLVANLPPASFGLVHLDLRISLRI